MPEDNSTGSDREGALKQAKQKFAEYLKAHPDSSIEEIERPKGARLGIKKPWGEDGLVIFLPDDFNELADALNNLLLPEPFTAVWHKDLKQLEVIWTAFKLGPKLSEVNERKFVFKFESIEHECEFGPSSERLLLIAEHHSVVGLSESHHRNLFSYRHYVRWKKETEEKPDAPPPPGAPISFWIRNLEWDEERIIRLARHLNFYKTYYDSEAPAMFIWSPKTEAAKPRTRYVVGKFPSDIYGRHIEEDLLHFWAACGEGDAGRRFVYFYRIIEYASYTYVERDVRSKVRKLLHAPHALSDTNELTEQVIAAALETKADDIPRISMLLRDAVDPSLLWKEIEQNRSALESETTFDGGFTLLPLISREDTEATFVPTGVDRFARQAREIRNHLSHGRDKSTQTSITPTVANFRKLEPWVSAISLVAGEVVNHKASALT